MDAASALAVLGLGRAATADDVRRAFRRRARETHPDAGGRRADFEALVAARRAAEATWRRRRPNPFFVASAAPSPFERLLREAMARP